HLDEAAVDGQVHDAVLLLHADLAGHDLADQRGVTVEDGQPPGRGPQHDGCRLARQQGALRSDDLHPEGAHRHQALSPSSVRAFSRTDSTPPTFKKACSGMLSRSPFTTASKDSTVSSTGTNTPLAPVKTSATKNGCDKKRWIFLARSTVTRSSSESSSRPRIAMMSCSSL